MIIIPFLKQHLKNFNSTKHSKSPDGIPNHNASYKDSPVSQGETAILPLATERQRIKGIFKQRKRQKGGEESAFTDNHSAKQFDLAFTAIICHVIHPFLSIFQKK